MIAFLLIAIAMTLAAIAVVVVPLYRAQTAAPLAALLAALAIPIALLLVYVKVSSYPWGAGAMAAAGTKDAATWLSLGEQYAAAGRYADARDAYGEAMRMGAAGDEVRLAYAEAAIIADRGALTGEAGRIIDEVLTRDPMNAKALLYGVMAAIARGDAPAARERWDKVLQFNPPPEVRQVIEQQLASMPQAGAQQAATQPPAVRIPVRIAVKPELARRIRPGAALFVIARAPGGSGPPLAVVRRLDATLPLELEISDADSMVPGRSMAGLAQVQLTARMANDGQALAAPGDVFGEAVWRPGEKGDQRLGIVMDRVVE